MRRTRPLQAQDLPLVAFDGCQVGPEVSGGAVAPVGAVAACGRPATPDAQAAVVAGRPKAALDLKGEHSPFGTPHGPYAPASRIPGETLAGWERPAVPGWVASHDGNMVAKLQGFRAGGFEVCCRAINLPDLARMMDAPRRRGKREAPEEANPEMARKAAMRARRKVRYSIKNIGADRLFTLTRRESDPAEFWDETQWAKAWDRFCRLARKAGVELAYVAVLERHKKGNLHLHVAITGWINIKLARGIWWAICGGRGSGNVDVSYRKLPGGSRFNASARIAKYISKYVTKSFEETHRFNKKRYWASREDLPAVRRIILNASNISQAFQEITDYLGLDRGKIAGDRFGFFVFPDDGGFWYSFDEHHGIPPPF